MSGTGAAGNIPRSGSTSLDLTGFLGLSDDDARRNIAEDGPNEIASQVGAR